MKTLMLILTAGSLIFGDHIQVFAYDESESPAVQLLVEYRIRAKLVNGTIVDENFVAVITPGTLKADQELWCEAGIERYDYNFWVVPHELLPGYFRMLAGQSRNGFNTTAFALLPPLTSSSFKEPSIKVFDFFVGLGPSYTIVAHVFIDGKKLGSIVLDLKKEGYRPLVCKIN